MTQTDEVLPLKLIETIYRAALDPQGYDAFMGHWHDWMTARISALDDLRAGDAAMSAPEIAAHFELALQLLERLGDTRGGPVLNGPQVLMDAGGRILWQNAEADRMLGAGRGRRLDDLVLSDAHRAQLTQFLAAMAHAATPPLPLVVQITATGGTRHVAFRAEPMREGSDGMLAILSSLEPAWPAAADHLLMSTHRLSAGECAVCAQLVKGLPPAAIAERRGTTIATVRTQIRNILAKTRQTSQAELTAYLHSLIRLADEMPAPKTAPTLPAPSGGTINDVTIHGRRMIIEEFGPADGYPVVFLHGMLDGTGVTASTRAALHDFNLRMICPHRPGFGRSEPLDGPPDSALHQVAADIGALLQGWNIRAPVMLGHMAGALFAVAAAAPCGACGVVNVAGGVPIVDPSQLKSMSRRQRLVAFTARYAPSVLPFVVNAGIRQITGGGAETFMRSLYENAPIDRDVLNDDPVRALVLAGYRFTAAQGHVGFATDCYHVVRDWTPVFEASAPLPLHLIHGAHDPVVSPASVKDFAARHADRVSLDMIEEGGQLLFYQMPGHVLGAVRAMVDGAQELHPRPAALAQR